MNLVVRPQAERDVAAQWHHIAERDEVAADRYLRALAAAYTAIQRQPGIGHAEGFRRLKAIRSWRVAGFPRYLVFYRIGDKEIEIIRVLHGMRNLPRFFG
jgi:toxin ParE1/3/4